MIYKEIVQERLDGRIMSSTIREATAEEVAEARSRLPECDHSLIAEDEPGWLFYYRKCAICEKDLGIL